MRVHVLHDSEGWPFHHFFPLSFSLPCSIFMIASSLVGSIFIFVIRYIIEIQRRLAFNNWNKQTKQIIKLKINLKEEKDRSSVTNIEEIYDIINEVGAPPSYAFPALYVACMMRKGEEWRNLPHHVI